MNRATRSPADELEVGIKLKMTWLRSIGVIDYQRANGIRGDGPDHAHSKGQDCSLYSVQTVTTKRTMNPVATPNMMTSAVSVNLVMPTRMMCCI